GRTVGAHSYPDETPLWSGARLSYRIMVDAGLMASRRCPAASEHRYLRDVRCDPSRLVARQPVLQGAASARTARSCLRLVHRRVRHARSAGSEGPASIRSACASALALALEKSVG